MTEHTEPEHGTFEVDVDTRTLRGILLPWGEKSRVSKSKTKPIAFERGTVAYDPSVVMLNKDHDRFSPLGAPTLVEDRENGIYAEFKIANTPAGDAYLADPQSRRKLSPELANIKRDPADPERGTFAFLVGAGAVTEGAFASAALFAIDDTDDEDPETPVTPTGEPTEEPAATPEPEQKEDPTVGAATIPASLATTVVPEAEPDKAPDANAVFELITEAMKGSPEAEHALMAIADIKISGSGQLPVGGNAVQAAWLGEAFQQKAYQRRYMPLIRNGNIVAIDEKGFAITPGAEPVQQWAGNKAELPTVTATTSALTSVFQRWGVANDIAREFYDIPAGRPVIEAYIRLLVNSYARVTDYWTLQQMVTAAGTQVDVDEDIPVDYNAALGKVIQAIDLVDDTDAEPTFVVVAADVWSDLRYTPKDQIPEYVTFSLRRTEGTADGGVVVLKDKAGILDAGQVLGGGREAAHVNELPGAAPLQLDALDIAHGGIDKAVIGYTQFMADYAAGLVLLGDPEVAG